MIIYLTNKFNFEYQVFLVINSLEYFNINTCG